MPPNRVPLPDEDGTIRSSETPLRRYRLTFISRGGMSCAYRGTLGQRSYFVKEVSSANPDQVGALRSEAQMLQRLPLGNFPRFVEIFEEDGHLYLVTEFLEGMTLEQEILRNPWTLVPEADLRHLALELCRQLEILHALKPAILYLDLKPANLIRSADGKVYLVDFGISRSSSQPVALGNTQGSVQTASPEHFTGKVDRRSDLFCLAATVHYVATRGQAERPLHGAFPSPLAYHPALSKEFNDWLLKCLSLNPDQRYADVSKAREALEQVGLLPGSKGGRSWLGRLGIGST